MVGEEDRRKEVEEGRGRRQKERGKGSKGREIEGRR
jgi:hypothetical protein